MGAKYLISSFSIFLLAELGWAASISGGSRINSMLMRLALSVVCPFAIMISGFDQLNFVWIAGMMALYLALLPITNIWAVGVIAKRGKEGLWELPWLDPERWPVRTAIAIISLYWGAVIYLISVVRG
ncbi:hypothetical protein JI739_21840 [Ramlibacter sp. AW1]|uniref:Uncharacterized protein n=1 Tax=Ramlibacter aurantiacus TaxID=2801330 RepID=A0A936ZKG8_9BURK|nr:hypothetical protein [Ramlibacter aurantiacus]MBL0422994.1 hypothetical protein [Ramlibacter aurantiacus]